MENPRSLGFARPASADPRPSPPILDRYRAMIRDRDEEVRDATGEDPPPPPDGEEVVRLYEDLLAELIFNSKPVITELTIIAGEQREHAKGIADAICARILEVPVDQKLPSLYLLDSIVKNIGREYVRYFAARLPRVFCNAYNQVNSSMHPAMRHLFRTWSQVFPSSVLRKIEDELQFSTPEQQQTDGLANLRHSESPSPRPSHGIHVNPEYLERHQFEHTAVEVQEARAVSPSLNVYGQRSSIQYSDYDYDRNEVLPPHLGRERAGSPRTAAMHPSAMVGVEGPVYSKFKALPSSPARIRLKRSISPVDDSFRRDASPGRIAERASPQSRPGYAPGGAIDQNGWLEKSRPSDHGAQQLEASTAFNLQNGYGKQRQRELIDAYGNYRGKTASFEKFPKVQRLDVNGINGKMVGNNWQSSEEEEYVWEDMSPTLADRSRKNSLPPLGPSSGSLSMRVGLSRPDASLLESDFRRNNWPGQSQLHRIDDTVDDRLSVLRSGLGPTNKKLMEGTGSRNEQFLHYHNHPHHSQEPGKFPYVFRQTSQRSSVSQGRVPQMPYSVSGITPPVGQRLSSPYEISSHRDIAFQKFSGTDSVNAETLIEKHLAQRPLSPPADPAIWPLVHKSQPLPLLPVPPNQKQFKTTFDFMDASKPIINQVTNPSMFLPDHQFDDSEKKVSASTNSFQFPPQQSGLVYSNQHVQEQRAVMRIQSQEAHGSAVPSTPAQLLSHSAAAPSNQMQGQGTPMGSVLPSTLPGLASSIAINNLPSTSLHGGILPPLPPGPPPASSQIGAASQNAGSIISSSPAVEFSGLISTLMAQGLISLTPAAHSQDTLGVEFSAELLKVRHESAINALYTYLPRQCTTCGLRFKCQEEHRNHMDWHVTKNRISKNRKQKPSRKWFVSAKEWLSGAETLGTDVVPGFLPTEPAVEQKEEKEMAVPADENQNVCALCGEPFEDFYSDEAEEWMYKGAVYLNAPDGLIEGLDRSQLGPIVHAKCRPESTEGSRPA